MTETVITGAGGFIGRYLVRKLNGKARCIRASIELGTLPSADNVFFLSTYGNMAHHTNHYEMIQANVTDLVRIVIQPKWFSFNWILYMSSSSVTLPVQTPYSRTKRAAEEILQSLLELKSCIVRPYSVTGVGEQKEHLIPTLIRSCMEGEEMPFDPYPVHDFIDVEDVVDALVEFAEHEHTGIFELGNGIPYTNQAVMEMVEVITGKTARVKYSGKLRNYDSSAWYCQKPSISGKKTLVQSITEMVEEYRSTH